MATLDIINQKGSKISQIEVAQGLLEGPVRKALLWETVKMQQANRRRGTASTKTRSEVKGSTRKIYRQKGTGNARHGDIKAPLFVGGGRVWGPHTRDYSYRIPRKARRTALKSVLALKFKEGRLKILENFELSEIKTKKALGLFESLGVSEALLVVEGAKPHLEKSIRNLPHYKVIRVEGLNVYDILNHDYLLVTQEAFKKIEEMLP